MCLRRRESFTEITPKIQILWAWVCPHEKEERLCHLVKDPSQAVKKEQVGSHYIWFLPHTCEIKMGERIQRSISPKDFFFFKWKEIASQRYKEGNEARSSFGQIWMLATLSFMVALIVCYIQKVLAIDNLMLWFSFILHLFHCMFKMVCVQESI